MRTVIVGGAGFIGSHLVDALVARGDDVVVFDPCVAPAHQAWPPPWLNLDATYVQADPRAAIRAWHGAAREADALVHLGALTGTGQSMYEVAHYTDVNATLSAWVAEELVSGRVAPGRVLLASTRAVYGDGPGQCSRGCGRYPLCSRTAAALGRGAWEPPCGACGAPATPLPVREDDPLVPLTPYAMTKQYAEQVLAFAGGVAGIPVTPLRLFNVYGPRQAPSNPYVGVVSTFARAVLDGRPVTLYEDGQLARDLIHVADVVHAILAVLDADEPPSVPVNIGSGRATTLRALADVIASVAGVDARIVVSGHARLGDPRSVAADITRATELLGWVPRWNLRSGIADLLRWLRDPSAATAPDCLALAERELAVRGLLVPSAAPALDRSAHTSEETAA